MHSSDHSLIHSFVFISSQIQKKTANLWRHVSMQWCLPSCQFDVMHSRLSAHAWPVQLVYGLYWPISSLLVIGIPGSWIPGSLTVFNAEIQGLCETKSRDFGTGISRNVMCWKAHFTTKIQIICQRWCCGTCGVKAALIPIERLYNGVPW